MTSSHHNTNHAAFCPKGKSAELIRAEADQFIASVRRLHAEGMSDQQMAKVLIRAPSTINSWRKRLGLPSNNPRITTAQRSANQKKALAHRTSPRRCLCCGKTFQSAHPGNRLCSPCKGSEHFRGAEWLP